MTGLTSHCNRCGKDTNHSILFTEQRVGAVDEFWCETKYYLLSCLGCDHVSYREENINSECLDPETGYEVNVVVYPKNKEARARPSWFEDIIETTIRLDRMLTQIYEAYDDDAFWLSIMGVRAVIETVMISKIGDHGSFSANLAEFSKQGFITDAHRQALTEAIKQGSDAIHKGAFPKRDIALSAIQVVENMLEAIYIVPLHEAKLKK